MTDLTELLSKGIEYPTAQETLYRDQKALYDFGNAKTDEEKVELKKKVEESALVFDLKGLPRTAVNAIVRKSVATIKDESERNDYVNAELLVRSITGITDNAGERVTITDESLRDFLAILPQPQFNKLIDALNRLEFDSLRHEDELTDPTLS